MLLEKSTQVHGDMHLALGAAQSFLLQAAIQLVQMKRPNINQLHIPDFLTYAAQQVLI